MLRRLIACLRSTGRRTEDPGIDIEIRGQGCIRPIGRVTVVHTDCKRLLALFGALLAATIYWQSSPRTIGGLDAIGFIEIALYALSGAASGTVYWLVAGRKAGLWR
jgi:hypothetical protein